MHDSFSKGTAKANVTLHFLFLNLLAYYWKKNGLKVHNKKRERERPIQEFPKKTKLNIILFGIHLLISEHCEQFVCAPNYLSNLTPYVHLKWHRFCNGVDNLWVATHKCFDITPNTFTVTAER